MAYKVKTAKSVDKFVTKLPKKVKNNYEEWKINHLSHNPYESNEGIVKKTTYKGYKIYKERFGQVRFCYIIVKKEVMVFIFKGENRDKVYKQL